MQYNKIKKISKMIKIEIKNIYLHFSYHASLCFLSEDMALIWTLMQDERQLKLWLWKLIFPWNNPL